MAERMKAGVETGSLMNHLYSGRSGVYPKVGMGCTILHWTDRTPATVTWVAENGRRIKIRGCKATRTDSNGMSDAQSYTYEENPEAHEQLWSLRKNGRWHRVGEGTSGNSLCLGRRASYYDYSF